jgi:hypothetical protein
MVEKQLRAAGLTTFGTRNNIGAIYTNGKSVSA